MAFYVADSNKGRWIFVATICGHFLNHQGDFWSDKLLNQLIFNFTNSDVLALARSLKSCFETTRSGTRPSTGFMFTVTQTWKLPRFYVWWNCLNCILYSETMINLSASVTLIVTNQRLGIGVHRDMTNLLKVLAYKDKRLKSLGTLTVVVLLAKWEAGFEICKSVKVRLVARGHGQDILKPFQP